MKLLIKILVGAVFCLLLSWFAIELFVHRTMEVKEVNEQFNSKIVFLSSAALITIFATAKTTFNQFLLWLAYYFAVLYILSWVLFTDETILIKWVMSINALSLLIFIFSLRLYPVLMKALKPKDR